jgi:hypothetical protein
MTLIAMTTIARTRDALSAGSNARNCCLHGIERGLELAFAYHFLQHTAKDERDIDEFERLPSFRKPHKVQIYSFTRNEIVFSSGERIPFLLPNLNPTGNDQVTFSTEKWDASLYPWRGERDRERATSAAK